jgi:hypothetical protein
MGSEKALAEEGQVPSYSKCNQCDYVGTSREFGKQIEDLRPLMQTEAMFEKNAKIVAEGLREKCPRCGYMGYKNDGYSDVTTRSMHKEVLLRA